MLHPCYTVCLVSQFICPFEFPYFWLYIHVLNLCKCMYKILNLPTKVVWQLTWNFIIHTCTNRKCMTNFFKYILPSILQSCCRRHNADLWPSVMWPDNKVNRWSLAWIKSASIWRRQKTFIGFFLLNLGMN